MTKPIMVWVAWIAAVDTGGREREREREGGIAGLVTPLKSALNMFCEYAEVFALFIHISFLPSFSSYE